MRFDKEKTRGPSLGVFWGLWFAIFNGLFILMFVAGGGWPSGANVGNPPTWMVVAPGVAIVAALAVRFLVIPRISNHMIMMPVMIVGLALAEAVGIIAIFVVGREFPETRSALFVASVFAVVLFAPFYASTHVEKRKMF